MGTWIAELPTVMDITDDGVFDNLATSLDISIDPALVVSGTRWVPHTIALTGSNEARATSLTTEIRGCRYVVVTGPPSKVDGLWAAGFESLTPIPPSTFYTFSFILSPCTPNKLSPQN